MREICVLPASERDRLQPDPVELRKLAYGTSEPFVADPTYDRFPAGAGCFHELDETGSGHQLGAHAEKVR